MNILVNIIFLSIAFLVMFFVGPAVYNTYGGGVALLLNPIVGWCLGSTACELADKIK